MSLVPLVPVDESIASSYSTAGKTGVPRDILRPLSRLGKAGIATADTAAALKALSDAVILAGGDFRVTECHRDVGVQKAARAKYDAWVAAGKPKPGTAGFNDRTMKAAFVATPGRSMHNAGRAIDVDLGSLKFPNIAADQQLDRLWAIAKPLGWSPIIKSADERASEAWHFDFYGDIKGVLDRLGYEQAALCGAILVGHGDLSGFGAELQALLARAGFDIGKIDGAPGAKTRLGLMTALRLSDAEASRIIATKDTACFAQLLALPAR